MSTRRRFLLGGAASLAALPFARTLFAGADTPSSVVRPKRFIAIFSANGQPRTHWFPTQDPDFTAIDAAKDARTAALTQNPDGSLSGVLVPELAKFRDKLVLVRGLDVMQRAAWGHYAPKMLSGWPIQGQLSRTIDQVFAYSPTVYPSTPVHRSVHLSAQGSQPLEDPISVADINGVKSRVYGIASANEAYRRLFTSPTAADLGDAPQVASERRVLDHVRERYAAMAKHPALGAEDRQRMLANATLVDDLEKRLLVPSAPAGKCFMMSPPEELRFDDEHMGTVTRDHIHVLVAAIRCNLTRVATLQLCSSTDARTYPDVAGGPFPTGHHMLTHMGGAPDAVAQLGALNRGFARSVALLLEALDVVEDTDTGRTYLDNSIVYWGNEFGTNYEHDASGMPVLLAGGAGVLKTGRYLDYRRPGLRFRADPSDTDTLFADDGGFEWRGRPYNQLLVSLLLAMGLAPAEFEAPDEPGFGDYSDDGGRYDIGNRRAPLPGLLA